MVFEHHILRDMDCTALRAREAALLAALEDEGALPVFRRWFVVPEAAASALAPVSAHGIGAVSCIGQEPLGGSGAALWLLLVRGAESVTALEDACLVRGDGVELLFTSMVTAPGADAEAQTAGIFRRYDELLAAHGMNLREHCLRTWLYCRDIDSNYSGLVRARRAHFEAAGLRKRYIASTGIEGFSPLTLALVQMDAMAAKGALSIKYLQGLSHLSPTSVYGVTFERGAAVTACGTSHILISGTAAIDAGGAILHEGDVLRQARRALDNIEVLLAEAGSSPGDVTVAMVYLREREDIDRIGDMVGRWMGAAPYIVLHAPVCRPGWLIEIECMARKKA